MNSFEPRNTALRRYSIEYFPHTVTTLRDVLTMICHSSRIGCFRWTCGDKERSKRFHHPRWCYSDMDYRQWRRGHAGRWRAATVKGGQRRQVLLTRICPGLHALHLFQRTERERRWVADKWIAGRRYSVSRLSAVRQLTQRSDPPSTVLVTLIS